MFWKMRRYILWPFWLFGTALLWLGSSVAFAGQWLIILCETVEGLPDMPSEIRSRPGVEL